MQAAPQPNATEEDCLAPSPRQLCMFRVGSRFYALDVLDVREINTELDITAVDHAPKGVRGLANVRGQIFLIMDAGVLLREDPVQPSPEARVVLLKDRVGPAFGLLVDQVDEIKLVAGDAIATRQDAESSRSSRGAEDDPAARLPDEVVLGVCKLPNRLVVVIDASRLLDNFRQ